MPSPSPASAPPARWRAIPAVARADLAARLRVPQPGGELSRPDRHSRSRRGGGRHRRRWRARARAVAAAGAAARGCARRAAARCGWSKIVRSRRWPDGSRRSLRNSASRCRTPMAPIANYVPFVVTGDLVFVSGQVPAVDGKIAITGKVGAGSDAREGKAAARQCFINVLVHLKAACGGDLDRVQQVVRLGGFIAAPPEFTEHAQVMNGASRSGGRGVRRGRPACPHHHRRAVACRPTRRSRWRACSALPDGLSFPSGGQLPYPERTCPTVRRRSR